MLLPLALLAGLGAGILLGGTPSRLTALRIRAPGLVVAAAALQLVLAAVPHRARFPLLALTYAAAAGWLVVNVAGRTLALRLALGVMALGWAANATVILANGGMPVSPSALVAVGGDASTAGIEERGVRKHLAGTEGRRLGALGDVVPLPAVGVVSAGDLVLAVGLAGFVAGGMLPSPARPVVRRAPAAVAA